MSNDSVTGVSIGRYFEGSRQQALWNGMFFTVPYL